MWHPALYFSFTDSLPSVLAEWDINYITMKTQVRNTAPPRTTGFHQNFVTALAIKTEISPKVLQLWRTKWKALKQYVLSFLSKTIHNHKKAGKSLMSKNPYTMLWKEKTVSFVLFLQIPWVKHNIFGATFFGTSLKIWRKWVAHPDTSDLNL